MLWENYYNFAKAHRTKGNFIEATRETRYFQISEATYGKPVVDCVITDTGPRKATTTPA